MLVRIFLVQLLLIAITSTAFAQQTPDLTYEPDITNPVYPDENGPVIFIDEGHHNFHTKEGRYKPFANLLEKDGYVVKRYTGQFEREKLNQGKILVIANALHKQNIGDWTLPTPSAFTADEIEILTEWVTEGGRLLLIADHMPFPGAAEDLGSAFGFTFLNGFNVNMVNPAYFRRSNETISDNVISRGRDTSELIHQIPMTEGQAFQIPPDAQSILVFDKNSLILMPDTAWQFNRHTPMKNIEGLAQGAYKPFGKGKMVVFGEASLFTAQIGQPGNRKMGMNNPDAADNHKLLLNIIHWLDDILN